MIFTAAYDIWSAFREFGSQAFRFGLCAALIYSVIIIFINIYRFYKHRRTVSVSQIIVKLCIAALFGVYASYAISLTLSGREAGSRTGYLGLIPGTTIFANGRISVVSVENWLLFLPFGILLPIIWKYFRSALRTGILAFISSMTIEITQFVTGRGYFEVDDIILNTFGGICGYMVFACVYYMIMAIKKRVITDVSQEHKITPPLGELYNRYILSNEYCLILMQFFPVVFMINIIMSFSSDIGQVSRSWSRPVAFMIYRLLNTLHHSETGEAVSQITDMETLMRLQSEHLDMIEKITRKVAHITEYALLAIFVWALIYSRTYIKRFISYISSIVIVMLVGLYDEFNQTHIYGRFGSIRDVGVDMIGAIISMILMFMISHLLIAHYRKKLGKS